MSCLRGEILRCSIDSHESLDLAGLFIDHRQSENLSYIAEPITNICTHRVYRTPHMQSTQPPRQPRSAPNKGASVRVSAHNRTKLAITETYHIAATCRSKLGKEADRSDLELRRLVCHANMLDEIMDQLTQSEQAYRASLLEGTVCAAPAPNRPASKLQWMDTISEEVEEQEDDDDDDDQDCADDSNHKRAVLKRHSRSPPPKPWTGFFDDIDGSSDEEEDHDQDIESDDEGCNDDLKLQRSSYCHRVPELTHDCDSASEEDEALPVAATKPDLDCKRGPLSITATLLTGGVDCSKIKRPLELVVVIK